MSNQFSIFEPLPEFASNLVMKYFPFPEARTNQAEVCWEIAKAFFMKKKFVVLCAPTGTGKSPIGMTVGRMISETHHKAMVEQYGEGAILRGSAILTRTRSLQQQYDDNNTSGAAVLWGKSHYSDIDADNPPDVIFKCCDPCPGMSYKHTFVECPHKIAKAKFFDTKNVGIANNALFLSSYDVNQYPSVLIVDECHTFVDALIEYSEVLLNTRYVRQIMEKYNCSHMDYIDQCIEYENSLKEGRIILKKIEGYLMGVSDFIRDYVIQPVTERLEATKTFSGADPRSLKKIRQMEKELKFLTNFRNNIKHCMNSSYSRLNWVCWKTEEMQRDKMTGENKKVSKIHLRPMDPLPEVVEHIMSGRVMVIFMSATTGSYEEFCAEMGLNMSDGVFFGLPSTFPLENRKIFNMKLGAMNYNNKNDLLAEDGEYTCMVRSILNQHKGVRGVIHTVSYANAEMLKKNIGDPFSDVYNRLVVVPRGTIVNAEYVNSLPHDAVIMSPSIAEGVDLRDDLARFQIILKIPFGNLGDPWMKAKLNRSSEWYENRASVEVCQMIGRIVRSEKDYGSTYILDSAFDRIVKYLPKYVRDAIVEC